MRLPAAFRSIRLLSLLHLRILGAFAALGLLVMALSRTEVLVPDRQLWSPELLGQLQGLTQLLLVFFVLLPVVPAVWGLSILSPDSDRVPYPRLAAFSSLFWLLGALSLLWAVLWGQISPSWLTDLGNSMTRDSVAVAQLLAILSACGACEFLAVHLLIAGRRIPLDRMSFAQAAVLAGSALLFFALPILATVAFGGMIERLSGLPLFDVASEGVDSFALWLGVLAASPLQMAVFLPVLGLCAHHLGVEVAHSKRWVALLALGSLFAVQLQGRVSDVPALLALSTTAFQCLLTAAMSLLLVRVLANWLRCGADLSAPRLPALASLLCLFWFLPIDLWTHLVTVTDVYAGSHVTLAHHLLLGTAVLLTLLRGAPSRKASRWMPALTAGILLSALATLLPLLRLGGNAIPASLPVYPAEYQPLQVLTALGGLVFLLVTLISLWQVEQRQADSVRDRL